MTRAQLELEVADADGGPTRSLTDLGFSVLPLGPADPGPDPLYLAIDCPHCRGAAPYPGQRRDGSHRMARCPGCEAAFAFDLLDVYVAASPRG